ncbi:methyltransferase domain-containing protein [Pantoea agglomerans]|uniref:methyltransferase domain-containing protein n=1 Tax=Enterobacter agglomerans TaxID=549 RepID=UPI002413BCD7|nr:methyltransferase domain-containing protein [Pantoea agglomerans]
MKTFSENAARELVFLPELGIGRYPVKKKRPYDRHYFANYQRLASTQMGHALTRSRIDLVARHYDGPLLDVGIGAGQFVATRPTTAGYDVNPAGIEWLKSRGSWADLYAGTWAALTFWDALEHIDDPGAAVSRAAKWVFVSIPVFHNMEHLLQSRHFKKDEHIWYFTHAGLLRWFDAQGFDCREWNEAETTLGRDGIHSYAFERRYDPA